MLQPEDIGAAVCICALPPQDPLCIFKTQLTKQQTFSKKKDRDRFCKCVGSETELRVPSLPAQVVMVACLPPRAHVTEIIMVRVRTRQATNLLHAILQKQIRWVFSWCPSRDVHARMRRLARPPCWNPFEGTTLEGNRVGCRPGRVEDIDACA